MEIDIFAIKQMLEKKGQIASAVVSRKFPDELNKLKNTQERWKSRFTSALHALKKQGVIEPSNSGAKNWQGGNYRITKQSPGVVDGADTRGRP